MCTYIYIHIYIYIYICANICVCVQVCLLVRSSFNPRTLGGRLHCQHRYHAMELGSNSRKALVIDVEAVFGEAMLTGRPIPKKFNARRMNSPDRAPGGPGLHAAGWTLNFFSNFNMLQVELRNSISEATRGQMTQDKNRYNSDKKHMKSDKK